MKYEKIKIDKSTFDLLFVFLQRCEDTENIYNAIKENDVILEALNILLREFKQKEYELKKRELYTEYKQAQSNYLDEADIYEKKINYLKHIKNI